MKKAGGRGRNAQQFREEPASNADARQALISVVPRRRLGDAGSWRHDNATRIARKPNAERFGLKTDRTGTMPAPFFSQDKSPHWRD